MEDYMKHSGSPYHECSRESGFDVLPLRELPLTMAYVPMQTPGAVYEPEEALCAGTLFPALDKPFLGRRWDK